MRTITSICLQLKEHKQTASLEAVAKVLEIAPGIVFSGKPKNNNLYSWVINPNEKHHVGDPEALKAKCEMITDYKELEKWLDDPNHKSNAKSEFVFLIEKMAN